MQSIQEILQWGSRRMRESQLEALQKATPDLLKYHWDTERLNALIHQTTTTIAGQGEHAVMQISLARQLRFADIKRLGNARVYNRPFWGVAFGRGDSIHNRLRSDMYEEINKQVREELERTFND